MQVETLINTIPLPDWILRKGIRRLLKKRLKELGQDYQRQGDGLKQTFIEDLKKSPITLEPDVDNQQHYEVPTEFFQKCLGQQLKYSCAYYETSTTTLNEAEEEMLRQTCQNAGLEDGMTVLDCGCGWGSLTLYIAKHFPNCTITSISNSKTQKQHIDAIAEANNYTKINVITANIQEANLDQTFDRIISIEMFEHMRNYQLLLKKLSSWLNPDGKLLVHIFSHIHTPYLFETEGKSNFMARQFFTNGLMPSQDLLAFFQDDVILEKTIPYNGKHYQKTCEDWLSNLDANKKELLELFEKQLGKKAAKRKLLYWRLFFMACAELFGYHNGNEWCVYHYKFTKR